MLGIGFNSAKCETTCRLCLGRIKILKNKRNMQLSQHRKEIAELLRNGKQDFASIRVESVIRELQTLHAYEILELYLELLAVRSPLVASSREIPRDMVEALSSVLYASSRVADMPELATLHKMFAGKYGKEYVQEASSDATYFRWNVNEKLRGCLTMEPPEPARKLEVLSEIAQDFGVEWDLHKAGKDMLGSDAYAHGAPGGSAQPQLTSVGSGYGAGVPPPNIPPPPLYQDAQQAAAAAAAAAMDAQRAAQFAQRLAGAGGSGVGGAPGGGGGGGAPLGNLPVPPPPQNWLYGMGPPMSGPPPPLAPVGSGDGPLPPTGSGRVDLPHFRQQSDEEIQRAYDAAQGPPPKGYAEPPAQPAPAPGPPPGAAAPDSDAADLPSVPGRGGGASASSELEELQRRLEELKRQP